MSEAFQGIEVSQSDCSEQVTMLTGELNTMKMSQNKLIAAVNVLKNEVTKLKTESNIHQRNWNDFNLT